MSWNVTLFMLLNASERPSGLLWLAVNVAAIGPVILAPTLLACLWIWGTPHRRPALIATAGGVFIGQGVNWLLGLAWYEPRPFMAGIGHTWMGHAADNGFPSDHATLGWSLGLGLVLTGASRGWGVAACLAAVIAGWSRIYLGVHFPLDVLTSAPAGLVAALAARLLLPLAALITPPLERFYEAAFARLPAWPGKPRRPVHLPSPPHAQRHDAAQ